MNDPIPLSRRLPQALIWLALGTAAFYLIAFVWKGERDAIQDWPLTEAKIESTSLAHRRGLQGLSKDGTLTVVVSYISQDGQRLRAQHSYPGLYQALRQRAEDEFARGKQLQVRIDPNNAHRFEPAQITTWGMWILAALVALFFMINGLTVLNQRTPASDGTPH